VARKQLSGTEGARAGWRAQIRYWLASVTLILTLVLGIHAYYRVENFLVSDPRFRFQGPPEQGRENPSLRIEGVVHASRDRVVKTFAADIGRSLYLLPLAERRRALLDIDWIKDASISRLWPDRLVVRLTERTPAAYIQLPVTQEAAAFRVALIDADGVILEMPPRASFQLPVLTGIRPEQTRQMRRERVRQALRLVEEAGSLADSISEIDVSDPRNLRVTQQVNGRAVVLLLGSENYLSRLTNFLNHYPEIQRRLVHATTFDLRLDDRITAVEEAGKGG
jgi:cell division protein FtsQ